MVQQGGPARIRHGLGPRACSPWLLYVVGVGVNVLTGLYAFRLYFTVFQGEPQTARVFAVKEAGRAMLIPVVILGVARRRGRMAARVPAPEHAPPVQRLPRARCSRGPQSPLLHDPEVGLAAIGLTIGTVASLIGIGLALRLWYEHRPDAQLVLARLPRVIPLLSYNKFYFDEIYDHALVRPLKAVARTARRVVEPDVMDGWVGASAICCEGSASTCASIQTGLIRDYASLFTVFAVVLVVVWVFIAR